MKYTVTGHATVTCSMVVEANSEEEAIEIVRNKTGYNFEFDASLADNDDVWE